MYVEVQTSCLLFGKKFCVAVQTNCLFNVKKARYFPEQKLRLLQSFVRCFFVCEVQNRLLFLRQKFVENSGKKVICICCKNKDVVL